MSPAQRGVIAFSAGALLASALALSGLEMPGVVLGAFRITAWDPRLPVMFASAIAVQAPLRAWMQRRGLVPAPVAPARSVDARLVIGAVIFGVGWGLGGICPGPGVVALLTMAPHTLLFLAGLVAGIAAYETSQRALDRTRTRTRTTASSLDR